MYTVRYSYTWPKHHSRTFVSKLFLLKNDGYTMCHVEYSGKTNNDTELQDVNIKFFNSTLATVEIKYSKELFEEITKTVLANYKNEMPEINT